MEPRLPEALAHMASGVPSEHLQVYVDDCLPISPYIVSVGSGNGVYEWIMCVHTPAIKEKLILVDPAPESFEPYHPSGCNMKPHFATVHDLVKKRPEVVDNCVMLLIWPDPFLLYDIEAVLVLKPKSIILLYEKADGWDNGCAASEAMAAFAIKPESLNFRCISTTTYRFNNSTTPLGAICPRLTWLARKGSSVPKKKNCLELQAKADKIPADVYSFYLPKK